MIPHSDLSRLSPEEKDALILALLDRIAALEAQLNQPSKTPDNSSLPPLRGPEGGHRDICSADNAAIINQRQLRRSGC